MTISEEELKYIETGRTPRDFLYFGSYSSRDFHDIEISTGRIQEICNNNNLNNCIFDYITDNTTERIINQQFQYIISDDIKNNCILLKKDEKDFQENSEKKEFYGGEIPIDKTQLENYSIIPINKFFDAEYDAQTWDDGTLIRAKLGKPLFVFIINQGNHIFNSLYKSFETEITELNYGTANSSKYIEPRILPIGKIYTLKNFFNLLKFYNLELLSYCYNKKGYEKVDKIFEDGTPNNDYFIDVSLERGKLLRVYHRIYLDIFFFTIESLIKYNRSYINKDLTFDKLFDKKLDLKTIELVLSKENYKENLPKSLDSIKNKPFYNTENSSIVLDGGKLLIKIPYQKIDIFRFNNFIFSLLKEEVSGDDLKITKKIGKDIISDGDFIDEDIEIELVTVTEQSTPSNKIKLNFNVDTLAGSTSTNKFKRLDFQEKAIIDIENNPFENIKNAKIIRSNINPGNNIIIELLPQTIIKSKLIRFINSLLLDDIVVSKITRVFDPKDPTTSTELEEYTEIKDETEIEIDIETNNSSSSPANHTITLTTEDTNAAFNNTFDDNTINIKSFPFHPFNYYAERIKIKKEDPRKIIISDIKNQNIKTKDFKYFINTLLKNRDIESLEGIGGTSIDFDNEEFQINSDLNIKITGKHIPYLCDFETLIKRILFYEKNGDIEDEKEGTIYSFKNSFVGTNNASFYKENPVPGQERIPVFNNSNFQYYNSNPDKSLDKNYIDEYGENFSCGEYASSGNKQSLDNFTKIFHNKLINLNNLICKDARENKDNVRGYTNILSDIDISETFKILLEMLPLKTL